MTTIRSDRFLRSSGRRVNRRCLRLATLLAAVLLSAGCTRKVPPERDAAPKPSVTASVAVADASSLKARRGRPKSQAELPTTSEEIYLANLDARIEELSRLLKAQPDQTANLLLASESLHTRGRIRGDLDEIQLGIERLDTCLRVAPQDVACLLARAEQRQTLHRFKESRSDLELSKRFAAEAGAVIDRARVADLEAELDWNDGRYDAAIGAIQRARRERPSTATWIREAQLLHDLGKIDEGEAAFEAAEDRIVDTGPLVVAHLNLQRGMRKMARGRFDEAVPFLREAVARLPSYVAAAEHLAEALHTLGRDDEATRLYEAVVERTNDPEFLHALAEVHQKNGRADQARALAGRAAVRMKERLAKFPEAMYWHASQYYLDTGDAKTALALLTKNVALRPNSESFVALADAQLASGQVTEAKKSIERALAMPVVSAALFWTASRAHERTGDASKAASFRAKAEAIDPQIATR